MTNNIDMSKIKNFIKDKEDIWVIGEREWSAQLARDFFKNHKTSRNNYNKNLSDDKGVFLLQSLPEKNNNIDYSFFENCSRLYFFNNNVQLFALKNGDTFLTKESIIKEEDKNCEKVDFKTITNIKYPKEYYKFRFASQIDVIPTDFKNNSIFVILNKETGEWRFSHEL